MKTKKILNDTIGISIGSVGISEANKIGSPMGGVLGTAMGAGLVMNQLPKKKKGGF